jgi:hypothetical protein
MDFFTAAELTSRSSIIRNRKSFSESANTILANEANAYYSSRSYDIFLSHSSLDANVIVGLKSALEDNNFSLYIYWIEADPESYKVTPETAERIRTRMRSCKGLLYGTSQNAENSKWMPWELGYFDGIRGKVAVCPITDSSSFQGREYLGLYPIMEKDFWLWKDGRTYKTLRQWLDDK